MTQERYEYVIDTVSFARTISCEQEFLDLLEYGDLDDETLLERAKDLRKRVVKIAEGY
jgi:hypothetical protein